MQPASRQREETSASRRGSRPCRTFPQARSRSDWRRRPPRPLRSHLTSTQRGRYSFVFRHLATQTKEVTEIPFDRKDGGSIDLKALAVRVANIERPEFGRIGPVLAKSLRDCGS